MCNRLPAHVPGDCPPLLPKWDDLPWAPPLWKLQQQADDGALADMLLRGARARSVYPPGPWPFQQANPQRAR